MGAELQTAEVLQSSLFPGWRTENSGLLEDAQLEGEISTRDDAIALVGREFPLGENASPS